MFVFCLISSELLQKGRIKNEKKKLMKRESLYLVAFSILSVMFVRLQCRLGEMSRQFVAFVSPSVATAAWLARWPQVYGVREAMHVTITF